MSGGSLPQTVLCIPGPWTDRSQLVKAIASGGSYLFAGRVLRHLATGHSFELEVCVHDPLMQRAFGAAGPHWKGSPEMERIRQHGSVVYLHGHGGSRANAEALMLAGEAVLKAGGLGLKVESSGIAHDRSAWAEMCSEIDVFSAYRAYVVVVTDRDVYTCGMHNLGLKDASVANFGDAESIELVRTFTWYLFTEKPTIRDGQTFSVSARAPTYRVTAAPPVDDGQDSLFTNPYGLWRLSEA